MVKKSVEWHLTTENVTTPSQIRNYIESCKDWLLTPPDEDKDHDASEISKQPMPVSVTPQKIGNIGIVREFINANNIFECFICGETTSVQHGRVMIANPFTRSQSMLVCSECSIKVKKKA